jgi:hypothetical protein
MITNPDIAQKIDSFIKKSHQWHEAISSKLPQQDNIEDALFKSLCLNADDLLQYASEDIYKMLNANLIFLLKYIGQDLTNIASIFSNCSYAQHKDFIQRVSLKSQYDGLNLKSNANLVVTSLEVNGQLSNEEKKDLLGIWMFAILHIVSSNNWLNHDKATMPGILEQFNEFAIYLEKIGNPNIIDLKGNTPLHHLCKTFCPANEIIQVITVLLTKGADVLKPNMNKDTPLDLALYNKYSDTALGLILKHINIPSNQLEKLLIREVARKQQSREYVYDHDRFENNMLLIVKKLNTFTDWNNYALIIDNKSIWKNEVFVNLNMTKITAQLMASFNASTSTTINAILSNKVHVTFHIAAIIAMNQIILQQENVLVYLAREPQLCITLNRDNHFSILSSVFKVFPQANSNIITMCDYKVENPLEIAVNNDNIYFFLLVLRLANKEIYLPKNSNFATQFEEKICDLVVKIGQENCQIFLAHLKNKSTSIST